MHNEPVRDYQFPYEPYDIQIQLMDKIYESIDTGKVAIIESPTGTGKSLSIICSVLKWISDNKSAQINALKNEIEKLTLDCKEQNSTDWILQQSKQISIKKEIHSLNQNLNVISKHIDYSKDLKKKAKSRKTFFDEHPKNTSKRCDDDLLDKENDLIVKYCEDDPFDMTEDDKKSLNYKPKIFYCSRTHSQLSQFINEVKKVKSCNEAEYSLMLLPLSSRVNYCINPTVNRFANVNMINEKCSQLHNSSQKCCMYKQVHLQQLSEDILSSVQDLEDIVTKGKQIKACPYYASRLSLSEAEIVTLPYNILLHKGTRESFGIDLTDSVVIVDEAHNLLETLASVYSVEINCRHLEILHSQVVSYLTKYYTRFNSLNLKYLKQLIFILKKFITFLSKSSDETFLFFDPLDFVLKLEIEHIDIYKLIGFIDKSQIVSKLHMFSLKSDSSSEDSKKQKISGTKTFLSKFKNLPVSTGSVDKSVTSDLPKIVPEEYFNSNMLYSVKEFLLSIKNYAVDGKILLTLDQANPGNSICKYLLLNTSSHFKDILANCRSVILCGGTMKPFEDYITQLFSPLNIPNDRILTFSCNHVIERNNLIAIGCAKGPNNVELNYTFSSRNSNEIVRETGQIVLQYCQVIPKGVVVFFPSYDYEESVLKQWQQMGILKMIEKGKRIFKETKKSSLTSTVLSSYSKYINASPANGAVLFSVMGGKMSEGINFSDDLGRGVIVVGLPYANKNSAELKQRMLYLERTSSKLSNEYYENLCMRAVNQSIGRAIRHKNDYAAIILLDSRYCRKPSVQSKLSGWITSRYQACENFPLALTKVDTFFHERKQINDS